MTHTQNKIRFATDDGRGMIIKQWARAIPLCFTINSHTFYLHLTLSLCMSLVCSLVACLFVNLNVDCDWTRLLGWMAGWLGCCVLTLASCHLPVASCLTVVWLNDWLAFVLWRYAFWSTEPELMVVLCSLYCAFMLYLLFFRCVCVCVCVCVPSSIHCCCWFSNCTPIWFMNIN